MIVAAVDPGPESSSYVLWDGEKVLDFASVENNVLLKYLTRNFADDIFHRWGPLSPSYLAIEQIRGFGVIAGNPLLDTCMFTGRFLQAFGEHRTFWVPRKEAAAHVCGPGGISKDSFVRQALIERFGGKQKAIGSKKEPGPLYGISGHLWAALAVAITWWDMNPELRREHGR